jgi:hypothetical protein
MVCKMLIIDMFISYDVQKITDICVVLLQNCVGFVEGETGYCSDTCVTCDVDGTGEVIILEDTIDIKEEVCVKVEEAIDIKNEIPQAIIFPPIKTEPEVRFWGGVCVCVCERGGVCVCLVCVCVCVVCVCVCGGVCGGVCVCVCVVGCVCVCGVCLCVCLCVWW